MSSSEYDQKLKILTGLKLYLNLESNMKDNFFKIPSLTLIAIVDACFRIGSEYKSWIHQLHPHLRRTSNVVLIELLFDQLFVFKCGVKYCTVSC
ncbi:hypothetical protein RB195_011823 [Necator americanus]|uniref:Uncharacterized protein n=1 Tax=Necator americanus TaxID=51031 RepID=A0ABR1D7E6_NECAM